MKIVVLPQNVPIFLPSILDRFITKLSKTEHELTHIVLSPLNSIIYSSLTGKDLDKEIQKYFFYYGLVDFIKLLLILCKNKLSSLLWSVINTKRCYSIENVCTKHRVESVKLDSSELHDFIIRNDIDLLISIASLIILPKEVLDAPKKGCINVHSSILPKYRGRQPLFWALLNGEKETGVTVHEMDESIDNGPIIIQENFAVDSDTLNSLYLKAAEIIPGLLISAINLVENSKVRIKNDSKESTYFGYPARKEGVLFRKKGKTFF